MKRLRDEINSTEPIVANAARLVADIAPLPESDVRSARVLRAIQRAQSARASRLSRPLLAALIVFGSAATAGAAWGVSGWMEGRVSEAGDSAIEMKQGAKETLKSDTTQNQERTKFPTQEKVIASQPEVVAASITKETEVAQADNSKNDQIFHKPVSPGAAASSKASASTKNTSHASEAVLVQQAVEALRQSNDPEQAAVLLKEYQQKSPSGVLAEEVLALSIEVAMAQGSARAQIDAARYLRLYPQGRFRALAKRALK